MRESLLHRWAAEVAGTALLVGIGTGTIVAAGRAGGVPQWLMALAWLTAVLVPIVLFIGISGAHLNPAVTLALAVSGRIDWRGVPGYVAAQCAGALIGSGGVWLLLGRGQELGATVPVAGPLVVDFVGEAIFSALLVASVFLLSDRGEGRLRWRVLLPPGAVGLSTYVIGPLTGSSLNPARTLGPAVLAGDYTDIGLYLTVVPLAAVAVALLWRPRSVDIDDRGPGRLSAPP